MIVVLDTNVWISALQFSRQDGTIFNAVDRAIRSDSVALSVELEDEIVRILSERFLWPKDRIGASISTITQTAVWVKLEGTVHVCRDPNDDMILECAERARAGLIVTGDKDLLALGAYKQTRIVTPAQYLVL
jgi:putative PIN family toxin of toxin-antitoxin system